MDDLINRYEAIEAFARMMPRSYTPDGSHPADEEIFKAQEIYVDCIETLKILPSAQPEIKTDGDTISRQEALDLVRDVCDAIMSGCDSHYDGEDEVYDDLLEVNAILKCNKEIRIAIGNMPSAQPFHNITMNDVLKYIDGMPEDVWQEFTACLECRGWELQRRTTKWCGGEFA